MSLTNAPCPQPVLHLGIPARGSCHEYPKVIQSGFKSQGGSCPRIF
jgi:hypothetical protein